MKALSAILMCCLLTSLSADIYAKEYSVKQRNKKFLPTVFTAEVGDTVSFFNKDDFEHNIFSLSGSQAFDLGTHKRYEKLSVKLEKVGDVVVECSLHPEMKMTIKVVEKGAKNSEAKLTQN